MNANIDRKIKKTIFIFAGYLCEMEDFLRVNLGLSRRIPNVLQFNDYTPMELAEITNKLLLTYEMSRGLVFQSLIVASSYKKLKLLKTKSIRRL